MSKLKKILVVDDEVGIRNLLFDVLSSRGFNVTLAKDGRDSLNHMQNRRFDLLITDINMPRIDGMELLKRMKKAGRRERVIVMTASPVKRSSFGADIHPVFTMLQKPFQMHSFLEVVSSALTQTAKKGRKKVKGKGVIMVSQREKGVMNAL